MKKNIKSSLMVLSSYFITLLIFGICLYVFFALTKDRFYDWLPLYSFAFFLLLFTILYSDFKGLAIKEKKPQHDMKPYPLKGLVLGMIGFSPFILIQIIYLFINFNDPGLDRLKELALKTLLGPLYWILNLGSGTVLSYIIASASVPMIAMLGYLAGFYNVNPGKYFRKAKNDDIQNNAKSIKKSPWNPSATDVPKKRKKK